MKNDDINIYLLVGVGMLFSFLVAGAVVLFYIRYQRRLTLQRVKMQEAELLHQKKLLHSIIRSQEEERARIGRDLHDDVGTALSRLRMAIGRFLLEKAGDPVLAAFGNNCKASIDTVIKDVRNIAHNLYPSGLLQYGFAGAVEEMAEAAGGAGMPGITIRNEADGRLGKLNQDEALALYRVLQELLTNTVKHAGAREARISFLTKGETLLVEYADDGKGMNAAGQPKRGMGMQNIGSRLGAIQAAYTIDTAAGRGFAITIVVPPRAENGETDNNML